MNLKTFKCDKRKKNMHIGSSMDISFDPEKNCSDCFIKYRYEVSRVICRDKNDSNYNYIEPIPIKTKRRRLN